mmetsp:Transcript_18445/g.31556  ORF Transcript_18445/g.31556 Transcript_18445/m.31556 type:complete len:99 (+) Transcript_18445:346-642(+)|eukprot:CAMPEP_0168628234 /NCGR_PEP_ID=MMETSP0449_2-20121227/11733_1 /TAXON_ID=1082188 /ORGANISM="Strombidium rassoulzadegani, Strain ras09" /LENGTH=98 /DNA_ID=CAMNT_0008670635 /DNA_START=333 /DNA_END=629 /DNA_ORIENTATION=-
MRIDVISDLSQGSYSYSKQLEGNDNFEMEKGQLVSDEQMLENARLEKRKMEKLYTTTYFMKYLVEGRDSDTARQTIYFDDVPENEQGGKGEMAEEPRI